MHPNIASALTQPRSPLKNLLCSVLLLGPVQYQPRHLLESVVGSKVASVYAWFWLMAYFSACLPLVPKNGIHIQTEICWIVVADLPYPLHLRDSPYNQLFIYLNLTPKYCNYYIKTWAYKSWSWLITVPQPFSTPINFLMRSTSIRTYNWSLVNQRGLERRWEKDRNSLVEVDLGSSPKEQMESFMEFVWSTTTQKEWPLALSRRWKP